MRPRRTGLSVAAPFSSRICKLLRYSAEAARTGTRQVYFDEWVDATVLDRARLGAGDVVDGPAVLEEFSSTVPLHPGFTARVDGYGNLVIRRSAS